MPSFALASNLTSGEVDALIDAAEGQPVTDIGTHP